MISASTKKPLGRPRLKNSEPHPVDISVGYLLRARRNELGLSQTDVGDRVGITFQQMQKYEKGRNRVSASRLSEFASVLDVPVGYFFADSGTAPLPRSADIPRLARECAALPPKTRKHLLALIRSIAQHGAAV